MIEVWGNTRGYQPRFIINPATGCFVRSSPVTAMAGNTVASVMPAGTPTNLLRTAGGKFNPYDVAVVVTRLDSPPHNVTALPISGNVMTLGVNADGSRLAVVSNYILTIYDTKTATALAS